MKKFGVCFLTLFASLLIAVPVALAAGGVTNFQVTESTAQVTPMQGDKTTLAEQTGDGVYQDAKVFHITAPAQSGSTLYLVLVHSGEKNQLPTESSIFYVDLLQAENDSVSGDAYPRDLEAGKTYHIELTDYANGGKPKEIATFQFTNTGGGGSDEIDSEDVKLGDLDNIGGITTNDISLLVNVVVGVSNYGKEPTEFELKAGDLDQNGYLTSNDVSLLLNKYTSKTYS